MVDVLDIPLEEGSRLRVLRSYCLPEVDDDRVPVWDHDVVLAEVAVHELRFIVQLLDQVDDFLVPICCRLKSHLPKDWSRDSILSDKSENQNILLHMDWFRN